MEKWIELALESGFSHAAPLDPAGLRVNAEVRAMCAANKCRAYDHNWTCPPNCGTLEECGAQIAGMRTGLLVQTTGTLEDSFDIDAMEETQERHLNQFHELAGRIREEFPGALCLGSGGCRLCETCAHPAIMNMNCCSLSARYSIQNIDTEEDIPDEMPFLRS